MVVGKRPDVVSEGRGLVWLLGKGCMVYRFSGQEGEEKEKFNREKALNCVKNLGRFIQTIFYSEG